MSVYIQEETVYLNGIYTTLTCLNDFDCGEDPDTYVINSYGSDAQNQIVDLIDTSRNNNMNYLITGTKLPYCTQFKYEYDGYINVTTAEEYTFYYKLEGTGVLQIDDNKIMDLTAKCYVWDEDLDVYNKKSIQLSVGLHKFYVKGYSPKHYYNGGIDYMAYRQWIKYSTASDTNIRTIPLLYGI